MSIHYLYNIYVTLQLILYTFVNCIHTYVISLPLYTIFLRSAFIPYVHVYTMNQIGLQLTQNKN